MSCRFVYGEESEILTGRVENLSFEGAQVTAPAKIPPEGAEIILSLRPDQENITLKAKVIYVRKTQFGVQFCGSRAENVRVLKPFFHL